MRLRDKHPEGERYQPCVNISAEPEAYFRIAPEDWLQAQMQGRLWRWSTVIPVDCPG
ncbi:phage tail protein [Escherichia coli]|nr:phage tail protein [Escherichia coli]